jgi:hypothetical protein
VGGNTANGGADYAYPYFFTVDGSQNVQLMCISFYDTINWGESWKAVVEPATNSVGDEEAAWLLNDAMTHPGNIAMDQDAAWYIFAKPAPYTGGNAQYDAAVLFVQNNPSADLYSDFQIYVPEDGTQTSGGIPQTFIGVTPEPSGLMLLGSGLALLAFGLFRNRLTA